VRSHYVLRISKSYESFGDRSTTTVIDDVATLDFLEVVKGVDVIIHVASPLPNTADPQAIPDAAVSGTTCILDAALTTGVKQFVITAGIASLIALADYRKEIIITRKCEYLT